MPWIVEYDHLDGCAANVASRNYEPELDKELTVKFRLYDGDDNLYYTGRMHPEDQTEDDAFAPLDDYGTPNAGCAYMTVFNAKTNKWEVL